MVYDDVDIIIVASIDRDTPEMILMTTVHRAKKESVLDVRNVGSTRIEGIAMNRSQSDTAEAVETDLYLHYRVVWMLGIV